MKTKILCCNCYFAKSKYLLYINKILSLIPKSTSESWNIINNNYIFHACCTCVYKILQVTMYHRKSFVHDVLNVHCDNFLKTRNGQYTKQNCHEENDAFINFDWKWPNSCVLL